MKKNIITIFIICLVLSGCKDVGVKVESNQKEIGRFQLVTTEHGPFLVDTISGDSWKYSKIIMKNGETWDSGWFAIPKKTEYEIQDSFSRLEVYEKEQKK